MQLTDGEIFISPVFTFTPSGGGEVDLTNYVQQVQFTTERDEKDNTRSGMTFMSRKKGLGRWSMRATLLQQFGSAQGGVDVDLVLWNELTGNTIGTVKLKAFNAVNAPHNPQYTGPATLFNHSPMNGRIGDLLVTEPEFRSGGNITRLTA